MVTLLEAGPVIIMSGNSVTRKMAYFSAVLYVLLTASVFPLTKYNIDRSPSKQYDVVATLSQRCVLVVTTL